MSAEAGEGTDLDGVGQAEIEGRADATGAREGSGTPPAAGPHAKPSLTNPDATPGTGSLPSASSGDETDAGTG